jgi:hypothetical protein
VPPEDRIVCRFAAEPPQSELPSGDWADTLRAEFLAACLRIDTEGAELGEAEDPRWFPDRTWDGITYVPVTARTSTGLELFGFVAYELDDDGEPTELEAFADFTDETVERHPEWRMDLCEEVVGGWRGEDGHTAAMTLVWGVPYIEGGVVATGELGGLTVDQCRLIEDRFTLLAPDGYGTDFLEIALWDARGGELARESLYTDDEDEGPAG